MAFAGPQNTFRKSDIYKLSPNTQGVPMLNLYEMIAYLTFLHN